MLSPPRRTSSITPCTTRRASERLPGHGHGPLTGTTIRLCRAGLNHGAVSIRAFSANKVTCLPRNPIPRSTRLRSSVPITTRPSHSLSLSGPSLRTAAGPRSWGPLHVARLYPLVNPFDSESFFKHGTGSLEETGSVPRPAPLATAPRPHMRRAHRLGRCRSSWF